MKYKFKKGEKQKLIGYIYRDFPDIKGKKITDIELVKEKETKNYITKLFQFRIDERLELIGVCHKK